MNKLFLFVILILTCFTQLAAQSTTKKDTSHVTTNQDSNKVTIETTKGKIVIELNEKAAPKHSANFRKLAREGYYEGTTFHRVIPGFMIQGGDPNSKDEDRSNDGMGGPEYRIDAEIGLSHDRGVIAAARQGDMVNPTRASNGSQFYITVADAKFLDGQYSVYGKVLEGMDVVDKIVSVKRDPRDNPFDRIVILKVSVHE